MAKKTTKSKKDFQQNQMFIVVASFALIGVAVLGVSHAQHGAGTGLAGNASIGATAECVNGAWVNHVNVISTTSRLGEVDVYETLNATQVIKVANELSLSTVTPTSFDTTPSLGVTDDVLYVAPFSPGTAVGLVTTTPGNEVLARSNTLANPCLPAPAPSGKGKHGA
jgi:hypothetical protein